MSENPQFDCLLGGMQDLPSNLNLMNFTVARSKEIEAMRKAISAQTGTKLAFQKLPKHMRRRAMSHNAKRLPRRLREIHLNQLKKSGMQLNQKKTSRKYRRRPKNLADEYARRQHRLKWLETHIWHAKRFHMIEKWGYRLPNCPCDKAFKACYRASSKHCLLQDISYFACIEISGPSNILIDRLKLICDDSCLSIGAKSYLKGNREGETTIFKYNVIPQQAIGVISFNWKPPENDENGTLWIWAHAAYYREVVDTLSVCFQLNMQTSSTITLKELNGELNRFRLTGPLAQSVLQNCFKISNNGNISWFQKYLEDDSNRQVFSDQIHYWKSIENVLPSELPPHIILSLIITDPRFNYPKKRTKAMPELNSTEMGGFYELPENVSRSPIWDTEIRKVIKDSKISNEEIAKLRSQLLVPGSDLELPLTSIPVLLIQRPGNRSDNLGFCSGWDIIIPSGWAQPLWISLVLWGGRAGGLRESESMLFELGKPDFLTPDTKSGLEKENATTNDCVEKFFKLPPNKRMNFVKLGITSPFACKWKVLINEWKNFPSQIQEFSILRNKNQLKQIQVALKNKNSQLNLDYNTNLLVPVRLKLKQKGTISQFTIICIPIKEDLKNEPQEPIRIDENQLKRKEMRKSHKILLKCLKKRRLRAKEDGKKIPIDMDMLIEYKSKMRKLWLPDTVTIRKSCAREVIGFVTKGGFSYSLGLCAGVGYITIGCLPQLLSGSFGNKVLVRSTSSRQYRFATLEIIL